MNENLNEGHKNLNSNEISPSMISALNTLGLTTYEAKIYAALVLYDQAGAKDLIDYLQISKPSIYESLQKLQDIGLVIKRFTKPAVFAPVNPKMALDILLGNHIRAVEVAGEELERLRKERIQTEPDETIWSVYGDNMVEHKIRDLITSAHQRIECFMGERYLPLIMQTAFTCPEMYLTVISDNPDLKTELKERYKKTNSVIQVIPNPPENRPHPSHHDPRLNQCFDTRNALDLIIDDREVLSIPPIRSRKLSGLNSTNPVIIILTRDRINTLLRQIEEGSVIFPSL